MQKVFNLYLHSEAIAPIDILLNVSHFENVKHFYINLSFITLKFLSIW
jgi:hypothetical protein